VLLETQSDTVPVIHARQNIKWLLTVKHKVVPLHAMRVCDGNGGIAPLILLDGGDWLASHPGQFTARGKNLQYELNRRLGRPQCQSHCFGEEIKCLSPTQLELWGCPSHNLIAAILTVLCLLTYRPDLSYNVDPNTYQTSHLKLYFKQIHVCWSALLCVSCRGTHYPGGRSLC
jgi:hypothetical protein